MKLPKASAAASAVVLALTLTACGEERADDARSIAPETPRYEVAQDVELDSPTLAKAKERGRLIIGSKADQPYLSYEDPATKQRSGFDIEIARMIAADLGFGEDRIEWKTVQTGVREEAIVQGQVDYYVGTYTINDQRKELVGFAGPYYRAGADLLVRKDEESITGPTALDGRKVCSIVGSTALQEIKKPKYGAQTTELSKYSDCVQQLLDGHVDAVTTDDAILKSYAASDPDKLKVIGRAFTYEPYGIGMAKDDRPLREFVNDSLERRWKDGTYRRIYDATLGLSGSPYDEPPAVERY
ncbi:glutamate ABC transporter substrate-binding protein [Streptomyces sp. CC228A]|uniref:glutamate ABC transporter substrate-binding protein n=1 Tax=Streptomyces sp. CC228A TaxID=2898186 RepID=UPI001F181510|nr:glutamate ABC transporter substrate-binding protein [Streptomyces sp. CC228A]